VVNQEGRLAPNFAFDGEKEQKRRLLTEGVTFKEGRVDVGKHLWG
jgi:alkylated DNA nucleotide flippase Atl1